MKIERVLLVHKKSVYQLYVQEHRDVAVSGAIERRDQKALRIVQSHHKRQRALERVKSALKRRGLDVVQRWRATVKSGQGFDLVVAVGGDGTLLDTASHLRNSTPLLGVNSDPKASVGALCGCTAEQLGGVLDGLRSGAEKPREVTRMRVRCDGEDVLGPGLNDLLFCHSCPAEMTRCEVRRVPSGKDNISLRSRRFPLEVRRGSGMWVCTGAGSTAASRAAGAKVFSKSSERLQYTFREPYVAPGGERRRGHVGGWVKGEEALEIVNRARKAMIYLDGSHRRMTLYYGQRLLIEKYPHALRLVVRPYR